MDKHNERFGPRHEEQEDERQLTFELPTAVAPRRRSPQNDLRFELSVRRDGKVVD